MRFVILVMAAAAASCTSQPKVADAPAPTPAPPTATPTPDPTKTWEFTKFDEARGPARTMLSIEAGQGEPKVHLAILCSDGALDVSIAWGRYLDKRDLKVQHRMDAGPASEETWSISTDREMLSAPNARASKRFIDTIAAGKVLRSTVSARDKMFAAEFDVSGLRAALPKLEACF